MSGDLKTRSAGFAVALLGVSFRADLARCSSIPDDNSTGAMSLRASSAAEPVSESRTVRITFDAKPAGSPISTNVNSIGEKPGITFGWEVPRDSRGSTTASADEISAETIDGTPPAVPLPSAFWSTMGTLSGLAAIWLVRRLRRKEA
jgi:hypothetical protein